MGLGLKQFKLFCILLTVVSVFSNAFASEIDFDQLIDDASNQQREVADDVHQQSGLSLQNKDKKTTEVEISGNQGFKVKLKKKSDQKKKHKKKRKPQSISDSVKASPSSDESTSRGPTPQ